MPATDYSDPEIAFPRLQVRIFTIDGQTQFVDVWLWKKAGEQRLQITKAQAAGSMEQAHQLIDQFKLKYSAVCDADDIEVEA
ncbi:MAG: hypothetical protein JWN34_1795 [Bryobacterales bacterium]|nr:hypothetical protein [Bryobacterales bacterium]